MDLRGNNSVTTFDSFFLAQGPEPANVVEPDPAWRAGATTLQGDSTQQFVAAEPMTVDPSRKVELVLRLVAR